MMTLQGHVRCQYGRDSVTVIKCANCGIDNDDDAVFCSSCNHFLEWSEPAESDVARASAPPSRPIAAYPLAHKPIAASPTADKPPADKPPADKPTLPKATPVSQPANLVEVAMASVEAGQRLAQVRDRADLAEHLQGVRTRLAERAVPVAVVGEFKRGKSTLVNALLQTAVCPVDADIVTAVPTVVRYGDEAQATAFVEPADGEGEPRPESVSLDNISEFVSEAGNPGNRRKLRSVEVRLPHLMLRSGLCLVDTPGVGGLDSAQGVITLSALSLAEGMLFLTDASQELTGPELTFLQNALERCSTAACVVSKTDLYPEWRRIVELNQAHLRQAGLDLPVLPVSSFLRLRSRNNPELLAESGFANLVEFIAGSVVKPAEARVADSAARDVEFITGQIGHQLAAERAVLERPNEAPQVVEQLDTARAKTERLVSPTATWQQMLTDGIQDLVAEIEFDLQERLRTVLRDVEVIVDGGDPKDSWPDVEVWLRRQVVTAAVANFDRLGELARDLADRVGTAFELDAEQSSLPGAQAPTESLAALQLASAASLDNANGRLASFLLAGRTATIVPMLLVGTLGHLLLPVVAPLAMVLAAGIGQKVIRDERKRQVAFRRQQAKQAARRYVDEVAFLVGKDSRDALRGTQRQLRDEFQARAGALHRSSETALSAAKRAMELTAADRSIRAAELAREAAEVQRVRERRPSLVGGVATTRG
jgi:hypothetical protein